MPAVCGQLDGLVACWRVRAHSTCSFVSELTDGRWIVTGLADDFESRVLAARNRGVSNETVQIESIDEALKTIFSAHKKSLRSAKGKLVASPTNVEECAAALQRFITAALGE